MEEVERKYTREYKVALKRLYEKKAEWAERFALALFASLVLGQIVRGIPFSQPSLIFGILTTAGTYIYANYLLNKSR